MGREIELNINVKGRSCRKLISEDKGTVEKNALVTRNQDNRVKFPIHFGNKSVLKYFFSVFVKKQSEVLVSHEDGKVLSILLVTEKNY